MTDKLREAAQQALDVLEQLQGGCTDSDDGTVEVITVWCPEVVEALRAALAQQDAQAVPTQRQYEMALRQWDHWKSYALELQAKLVKYEGGSPMVLNAAPTPPVQQDVQAVTQGWYEFLKEIEWANSGHGENGDGEAYCVCCNAWQHEGHQLGCKFFAMLNAATAPAQRVMLTPDEIDEVWSSIAGHSIYAEYQMEIARAMIEAYERKNGIK